MNINSGKVWTLLGLMLLVDAFFIFLHILAINHLIPGRMFSIECDGGFAEMFQYTKEGWLAFVLISLATMNKQRVHGAWAGFFAFLLFDDAFQIHENAGELLVHMIHLTPMFNMRAQDLGELAVYGISGLFLLGWIAVAHFNSQPSARRESFCIGLLVAALFFCGVVVDMLHSMVAAAGLTWHRFFGVMEDGGEMVVLSVICVYVFRLALANGLKGVLALDWLLHPLLPKQVRASMEAEEDPLGIG